MGFPYYQMWHYALKEGFNVKSGNGRRCPDMYFRNGNTETGTQRKAVVFHSFMLPEKREETTDGKGRTDSRSRTEMQGNCG